MAPFRDAMRFIDGIKGNLDILQKLNIFLFRDGFRSHIEQLGFPVYDILFNLGNFLFGE